MKKQALVVLAALGIGASGAAAQQPLYGSDTWNVAMRAAIAASPQATELNYAGGGSSLGGRAMTGGNAASPVIAARYQQIAPQSRRISSSECSYAGGAWPAQSGQTMLTALDALGIYKANDSALNACTTLRHSGNVGGHNYASWHEVLRILYTGLSGAVVPPADPCDVTPPARTPAAPGAICGGRCDSPERIALIRNWNNLFQDAGCASGPCPDGLRHAWRRDDLSGTTDTFLELLGLPAIASGTVTATNSVFCNGAEAMDEDPVRTPCVSGQENVCQALPYAKRNTPCGGGTPTVAATAPAAGEVGDLGVVLAITIPTDTNVQYNGACGLGRFALTNKLPFALTANAQQCPDGNRRQLGQCAWPQTFTGQFNCLATPSTRPAIRTWVNMDGRVYNTVPRHPTTGDLLIPPAQGVADPRWSGAGAYKIHQANVMANSAGASTCNKPDATEQIGCLVKADRCSIGFAGGTALEVESPAGTRAATALSMITPDGTQTVDTQPQFVQRLVAACPARGQRYPLARGLYISSAKGFGNLATLDGLANTSEGGVTGEKDFLLWIKNNKPTWEGIVVNSGGFVATPSYDVINCNGTVAGQF